jgi:ABC-type methionine transport system permease subunit
MKRLLPVAMLAAALSLPAGAQCVMCYRTAHAQNNARSRVLDMGIVILGAPPFLILAGFIAFVFAKDKVGQNQEVDELSHVKSDVKSDVAW